MILSLDQSLTATGFIVAKNGVIYHHGVIKTESEKKKRNIGSMDDACRRTVDILARLKSITLGHKIKAIVCEEYSGFTKSKNSADALATARTIVCATAYHLGLPMFFVSQKDVKNVFGVKAGASKTDCINSIAGYYSKVFEPYKSSRSRNGWMGETEHVADALGVYLAGRKLASIKVLENL